jgi:hypothetical protein
VDRLDHRPAVDADPADVLTGDMISLPRCRRRAILGALAVLTAAPSVASAACPIELSAYRDRDGVASIEFTPAQDAAAVTNSFRLLLDNDLVLTGIVMWTDGVARPNGMITHQCPEGDVTGEEIAACTIWQGVVYSADAEGKIDLLPKQGAEAPPTLVLPDLGPSVAFWSEQRGAPKPRIPWDVFALQACQE